MCYDIRYEEPGGSLFPILTVSVDYVHTIPDRYLRPVLRVVYTYCKCPDTAAAVYPLLGNTVTNLFRFCGFVSIPVLSRFKTEFVLIWHNTPPKTVLKAGDVS